MTDQWTITPYCVGLLLEAPDDIAPDLVAVYRAAEIARCTLGYHPSQPAGKAIHAVIVQHYAEQAHRRGNPELAAWLTRAAGIVTADAALELDAALTATDATETARQTPG